MQGRQVGSIFLIETHSIIKACVYSKLQIKPWQKCCDKVCRGKEFILICSHNICIKDQSIECPSRNNNIKFSIKRETTRTTPATKLLRIMITSITGQWVWQSKQCKLPKDRLSPGLLAPQSVPERLWAHWASAPFGMLKLISTLEGSSP